MALPSLDGQREVCPERAQTREGRDPRYGCARHEAQRRQARTGRGGDGGGRILLCSYLTSPRDGLGVSGAVSRARLPAARSAAAQYVGSKDNTRSTSSSLNPCHSSSA